MGRLKQMTISLSLGMVFSVIALYAESRLIYHKSDADMATASSIDNLGLFFVL